jgi:hypothetical protein
VNEEDINKSIICLNPFENKDNCEVFQPKTQTCYDSSADVCIDWVVIFVSIVVTNVMGLICETAFAYSFEMTLRPTYLDRMEDPEQYDDE